ncbi:MAG: serine/threonine protein kinase [Deltaproteobacteria bacterium]|nr:serine/threonine protein kinase [Deltaproteobacteria bacterium]
MASKPSRPPTEDLETAGATDPAPAPVGQPKTGRPGDEANLGLALPKLELSGPDEDTEFSSAAPWLLDDPGDSGDLADTDDTDDTVGPPGALVEDPTKPVVSPHPGIIDVHRGYGDALGDGLDEPTAVTTAHQILSPEAPVGPSDFERRYERIGPLAEGGMGEIITYLDRQIGREVAIKTMRSGTTTSAILSRRFAAEARVQGQLEHPAIVPVYDLGIDGQGQHYFTMPRIHGESLEDVILRLAERDEVTRARFPRRRLVSALATICLAIDFAHQRQVLHRDLKPANIMLGEFGEVHLLDWGVARINDDDVLATGTPLDLAATAHAKTQPGSVLGTLGYMAPEQLRGAGAELTPSADVYALGAILFEICTLEPLHSGDNFGELVTSTLGGVEARPSLRTPGMKVPAALEQIIVRAVAPELDQRYGTARALHRALEAYLDDERDEEHRLDLALAHGRAAKRALRRAGRDIEERRRAIREVGRALALDPDNGYAAQSMRTLLDSPPDVPIPAVDAALEKSSIDRLHWFSRLAALGYLSFLLFLPLVLVMGVRSWAFIAIGFVGSFAAAASSYAVGRGKLGRRAVVAVAVISSVALGSTAAMFGPLVLTPALVGMNITGFAITLSGRQRRQAVGAGILTVVVTMALGVAGLLPGGYAFTDGNMVILPGSLDLPATPAMLLLALASLVTMCMPVHLIARLRDELLVAERRQLLHSWHLGELLPPGRAGGGPRTAGSPDSPSK